ncbi:MAG TPA: hypothetical protein VLK84_00310 [Longimicrobium sp.]|nr:hypothetical protein [Longimicrobium sp.]
MMLAHTALESRAAERAPARSTRGRCACGGAIGPTGECARCRQRRLVDAAPFTRQPASAGAAPQEARSGFSFARVAIHPPALRPAAPAVLRGSGGGARPDGAVAAPAAEAPVAAPAPDAAAPADPAQAGPLPPAPAPARAPTLMWTHVLRSAHDALWFFCGAKPSGFSTTARLRARGFGDPAQLSWQITRGSSRVAFDGAAAGEEVRLRSTAGSNVANDVTIQLREGTGAAAATYVNTLTVRRPHRLVQRFTTDAAGCAAGFAACPATCASWHTDIGYRVEDNVGGTIVGATVNENFPGTRTSDQANNWVTPASFSTVPVWPQTNGTFEDHWMVWCGTPSPVAPTAANANTSVDHMPHEFYVGNTVPGSGCRVQTHTTHRYLGYARHEGIVTPAP